MSTSILLECACDCEYCDHIHFDVNYTHNVNPMMYKAADTSPYVWAGTYGGREARYLIPVLEDLIIALEADPETYREMNPENGWGDYDTMLSNYLIPLLQACRRYPDAIVYIRV